MVGHGPCPIGGFLCRLRLQPAALVLLELDADLAITTTAASENSRVRPVAAEALGLRGAVEVSQLFVDLLVGDDALEVKIRAERVGAHRRPNRRPSP